jgi:serine protease Do
MGGTVNGDLGAGDRDRWTFTGAAGQVVTIRMTSQSIDPYLELLGPDGTQLIFNDDGAGYPNALIEAFELPTAGTYTIVARSFGDSRSGPYVLSLDEEPR